jgi:hypothetical protein
MLVLPREHDAKVCKLASWPFPVTIEPAPLHPTQARPRSAGLSCGPANLFVWAYEVTIVRDAGSVALSGVVQRGLGPAQRLEIALREGEREQYIEVTEPRHEEIRHRPTRRSQAAGISAVWVGPGLRPAAPEAEAGQFLGIAGGRPARLELPTPEHTLISEIGPRRPSVGSERARCPQPIRQAGCGPKPAP